MILSRLYERRLKGDPSLAAIQYLPAYDEGSLEYDDVRWVYEGQHA